MKNSDGSFDRLSSPSENNRSIPGSLRFSFTNLISINIPSSHPERKRNPYHLYKWIKTKNDMPAAAIICQHRQQEAMWLQKQGEETRRTKSINNLNSEFLSHFEYGWTSCAGQFSK